MELETLASWRWSCRAAYYQVLAGHKRGLRVLLRRFFLLPESFLRLVTDCRAVIGGEFALAFILRDPNFHPAALDVYATDAGFEILLEHLVKYPIFSNGIHFLGVREIDTPTGSSRGYRRQATFEGVDGFPIRLFESTTMSPCTPISRSWSTALMNFVTEHAYGSAYVSLTRRRRALVSDLHLAGMTDDESDTLARLTSAGYSHSGYPTAWEEYAAVASSSSTAPYGVLPCMRRHFVCPDQGRFFGDGGSVVRLLDPLQHGYGYLLERFMPPLGHMPVWRLWNSNICDAACAFTDEILSRGIISITMLPAYAPASFRRERRPCNEANQYLPSSTLVVFRPFPGRSITP